MLQTQNNHFTITSPNLVSLLFFVLQMKKKGFDIRIGANTITGRKK
ncbi:hypothetical protein CIG2463D_1380 [Campylobacter iguaniorum]|nr:hypothetical protein [Campylobacter iguaniorum]ALV24948.1 hypothetical protein CIG2463D_1380 [Campylobacter iguaniorum]